ncbi:YveK family protein [Neobacillus vireti]|uniref:YveK family protein n=1 Tax=Neobacillus vireti TaxID=220686 RepID=UPI002FFF24A3
MNFNEQLNTSEEKKTKEIDLKELFIVVKRRIWIIILIAFLGCIIGVLQYLKPTVLLYQTSSKVIIGTDSESRATLQVLVRDPIVLDEVVNELKLNETSDTLAGEITVASIENSQVVSVSVINQDPVLAAKIADTTAKVFKEKVPEIVGKDYIRVLSQAKVNLTPINPKSNKVLFIAVIGGIVIGIGLAFLFDSLDDKIYMGSDIEKKLGISIIGKVPKVNKKNIKSNSKVTKVDIEPRGENIGYK